MNPRLNHKLRNYIATMRPMLRAGLHRLPPGVSVQSVRYEMAINLGHTVDTCTDELSADVATEIKRLFEFVASQGHREESVN